MGRSSPFLGAGANLGDRPPDVGYQRGRSLPSGRELAEKLARFVNYKADVLDLARVSQYVAALLGEGPLYDELHDVFDADYPPTLLQYFLARLARHTREAEAARECMLLVTTNYDDALEQAFRDVGEPYDLLTYIGVGTDCGFFRHIPFEGEPSVIRIPNEYTDLPLDRRTVIAKIHGAVDRLNRVDSFVITDRGAPSSPGGAAVTGATQPPPVSQPELDRAVPECPYVGFVPFDESDAPYFFDRQRERDVVVANLTASRGRLLHDGRIAGLCCLVARFVPRQPCPRGDLVGPRRHLQREDRPAGHSIPEHRLRGVADC